MSQITIEITELIRLKEEFNSELTPGEILLLKCIANGNIEGFEALSQLYPTNIPLLTQNLQNKLYIKITGSEFKDLILRDKGGIFKEKEDISFDVFWDCYHKITGLPKTDMQAAKKYWKPLTKKSKQLALDNIENYYNGLNDKRYCKKARTYLSDRNFLDEFVVTGHTMGINQML